ncbi:hypothetical protein Tco_1329420 [Tanacetum coccineum]
MGSFEQIVDFLNVNPIRYALTINPTIYISCIEQFCAAVKAKTINGEVQLHALVDGKKIIITESIVRNDLQLEDAEGVDCLSNATIFEQLALMGYEEKPEVVLKSEDVNLTVDEVSVPSTKVSAATTTTTAIILTPRKGIVIAELAPTTPCVVKRRRLAREQRKMTANVALTKEWDDIQAKQKVNDVQETAEVDNDQEAAKIKELMEIVPDKEEVAIDDIPLAVKPPSIVDWKIHKKEKKTYYQIIRADGSSKIYAMGQQARREEGYDERAIG